MTLEEVITWTKENKINPSQVFSNSRLKEDPVVETIIEKETKSEYKKRMDAQDALETAKTEWTKKETQLTEAAKTYKVKAMSIDVAAKAKSLMDARKLNEQETKFLLDHIKDFTVEDPEKIEPELNKRLDEGLKKFNFVVSDILGIKKDETPPGGLPPATPPDPGDIKNSKEYKELTV